MKPTEMSDYWKNNNLYTSYLQFNVCRLCAEECDSLTPIFGNVDENERLDLKIKKCLPLLMVQEDDIKPKQVCMPCVSKLNLCSGLIESCIAADYKFEVLIQKAYNSAASYPVQAQDMNYLNQSVWASDSNSKPEEKSDVLIIENLNSSVKTTEQEFVVMVELKYKNSVETDGTDCNNESNKVLSSGNNTETIVAFVNDVKDLTVTDVKNSCKVLDCSPVVSKSLQTITDLNSQINMVDNSQFSHSYCEFDKTNLTQGNNLCTNIVTDSFPLDKQPQLIISQEDQFPNRCSSDVRSVKTPELDGKRYKCTACDKSFARKSRCKAHIISHSQIRPFKCGSCGKSFLTKWECRVHQRIHNGVHTCEFCGKAFSVKNKLERHRRVHTGEKPFACTDCSRSFADKRNLDNHLRTHTGERPYVCQTCNDSFRTLTHLKDHQTVHSKEALFSCYFCNKRFKWKTNLQIHLKKHSSKDLSSVK